MSELTHEDEDILIGHASTNISVIIRDDDTGAETMTKLSIYEKHEPLSAHRIMATISKALSSMGYIGGTHEGSRSRSGPDGRDGEERKSEL